mgnify:CR=1 FL=1
MQKADLLEQIQAGWENLQAFINSLDEAQFTAKTDAAGWTVKDHLMHLAVWEDGLSGLVNSQPRWERMGVPQDVWDNSGYDKINAVIQQQHHAMPLEDVLNALQDVHKEVLYHLNKLTDADLELPYKHYQADSPLDKPIMWWLIANTYEHYAEHIPWMQAILEK